MIEYIGRTSVCPDDLQVRQVYGFLFADDGRVLIRVDGGKHSLPGGRPEPGETTHAEILRREVWEEVIMTIHDPHYIGYQAVDHHDGTPPYAQIRMVARIKDVHPIAPDPDNGRTYRRLLVAPEQAGDLLNWTSGRNQLTAAAHAATTALQLPIAASTTRTYI
ncbi:MAG TPA: NUDIX domain-containing protein [Mycobacteriales bacterium]|jgi:8-oxo-dGTP pyrophosphatase MutT (NUDIX family)|nr:NUDIX domain-containing protein [Mycobacteriales bacterium]